MEPGSTAIVNSPRENFAVAQWPFIEWTHQAGRTTHDGPEGQYYFDPSKQLPTLRKTSWQEGDEALLLAQEGKVRRIQPVEVWRLKGGSTPAWRAALAEGHTLDELATWAVRTPSLGVALAGAAWCVSTLRHTPTPGRGERHAGVCPLPDEEEAWAALKGWLAAGSVADGVRRVGGPKKRKGAPPDHAKRRGVPPDNSDLYRLAKILVAILRTRVVELHGDTGGWVPLQAVQDTVAACRIGAAPPKLGEVQAAIVASEGRLELRSTGGTEEYQLWACQGHTGGTALASLGQPLGTHEPWMLHATFFKARPVHLGKGAGPARHTRFRGAHPSPRSLSRHGDGPKGKVP